MLFGPVHARAVAYTLAAAAAAAIEQALPLHTQTLVASVIRARQMFKGCER